MQINTDGLVIAEKIVGENDRLITLLTRDEGVIRAFAPLAKTLKSKQSSATQLLCYSQFAIYRGRDKYIVNDAQPLQVFFDLRSDIETVALAQYFCQLAAVLAPAEMPAGDFLRLVLNALHLLAQKKRPHNILKAAVEMRMLALAGYMPDFICCQECGVYQVQDMVFLPASGVIYCSDCYHNATEFAFHVTPGIMTALRHTIYADFDKVFSFQLPLQGQRQLAEITEAYLLQTLERRFTTLDFYHQVTEFAAQTN